MMNMKIREFFKEHSNVVVAVSGGVDSAVLLALAAEYAQEVHACFVKTAFQPEFELKDAAEICSKLNIKLNILEADVLKNDDIVLNNQNRCYYCKKLMFEKILAFAKDAGSDTVLEGTNVSDDVESRPGYKALKELGILSPLRICEMTKSDIRETARKMDLSVFQKPSYACLATRVPTGERITAEILTKTEKAEDILLNKGFSDFRIRYRSGAALIQINDKDYQKLILNRKEILSKLSDYYSDIMLDLKGRESNG